MDDDVILGWYGLKPFFEDRYEQVAQFPDLRLLRLRQAGKK